MKAIPEDQTQTWEKVLATPIIDNNEALVPLSLAPEKILVRSAYFAAGIHGALPECYARESVQQRLLIAASLLPDGIRPVILDGWRNTVLQQTFFEQCCNYYRHHTPDATEETIHQMASTFVAVPSNRDDAPSPHLTGGAIDLSLADHNGRLLFFGSPFDYAGEISTTRYFECAIEQGKQLDEQEKTALYNRRLLYEVMTEAGFVNYDQEWWHFEYGSQRWAFLKRKDHAIYGPATLELQSFAI